MTLPPHFVWKSKRKGKGKEGQYNYIHKIIKKQDIKKIKIKDKREKEIKRKGHDGAPFFLLSFFLSLFPPHFVREGESKGERKEREEI